MKCIIHVSGSARQGSEREIVQCSRCSTYWIKLFLSIQLFNNHDYYSDISDDALRLIGSSDVNIPCCGGAGSVTVLRLVRPAEMVSFGLRPAQVASFWVSVTCSRRFNQMSNSPSESVEKNSEQNSCQWNTTLSLGKL